MKFNPNEDFGKNVGKLLTLLKRMLSKQKIDSKELNEFFGKKDINLNVCFFTFMPFSFDEMEEMEMEEMMGQSFSEFEGVGSAEADELKFELNKQDLDFLKQNGMKF